MWRNFAGLVAALCGCALFGWPLHAAGSHDLFGTEQQIARGRFAESSDAAACQKDRIKNPLALVDVVELALCNNPQTRSAWANARAQAAQLGSSMSPYLPTLSGPISVSSSRSQIGASATDSTQQSIGVTASYLLYDFGGRAAGVENAKQVLVAANASRDGTLQNAFLGAVQSYYALLSARASVQSYLAAEVAASKSMDAAQARYKAGTATQADRLQAQTALSQAVLNRIRAEGEAANAQGALANAMGFDASQPFELAQVPESSPDPVAEQGLGDLLASARHSRPDLLAAEAQIKAAEANLAAIKAGGLPVFTLNGTVSRTKSQVAGVTSTSFGNTVGVSVSVPWFSGFRDTYRNRAARAQIEGTVAERDRIANQIALEVWQAYQALLTNSQALRAADDLVASAAESEKMALGRYKAGIGSILDTLTAQSTLAGANQQRVAALYNFLASKFALAQAIGQLDLTMLEPRDEHH
ncbi:MAG: TolC family protein [Nitrosomonadales bacterium]|nr:TolC family protein [Nitrosomonadales bacterium]